MSQINILFYSNHCEASQHLLALMNAEKLTKFFHLFCTDNNPNTPPQIKLTPTLLIKNVPTPYVAADAFAWLSKVKQWKNIVQMRQMSTAHQQYFQNMDSNLTGSDLKLADFNPAEIQGMSDIFAWIEKDSAMPHTFFNYDNLGQETIFTPPKEEGRFKINAARQKEMHEKMLQERQKQDNMFKKVNEEFRKKYAT
jgi:hypothetical protein